MLSLILYSENEENVQNAQNKICENCGIPNFKGTTKWDDVQEFDLGFYITAPPQRGWNQFSKNDMLEGVNGVIQIRHNFTQRHITPEDYITNVKKRKLR